MNSLLLVYGKDIEQKETDLLLMFCVRDEAITIRMTGCPNGCARPYIAEIGLVGKAPGIYNLYHKIKLHNTFLYIFDEW